MARAAKNVMSFPMSEQARRLMRNRVLDTLHLLRPKVLRDATSRQLFDWQVRLASGEMASPADVAARQLERLKALAAFAAREAPYWRERLRIHDILAAQTLPEALAAIPVLTRADLRDHPGALRSENLPPRTQLAPQRSSSGSTGMVVAVDTTNVAMVWQSVLTFRTQLWAGRDLEASIAVIRRYPKGKAELPDGLIAPHWAPPGVFPFPTGPAFHLTTLNNSIADQWDWLARMQPTYLMTYPSVIRALAERARALGQRLPSLKAITTVGEQVDADLRAMAVRYLDAPISDIYSSEEAGVMALQCPMCPVYHVQAEALIMEVVDDDGSRCAPGEPGRVVVTPLHNYAMPLFRYEIGDYAEMGEPCACGRGLPVLTRILGRRRNMLVLPNGGKFWPSFGARALQKIVPMREHQFRQIAPNVIEALLVTEAPVTPEQEEEMRGILARGLPVPFDIRIRCVAEIPRPASGKHEEFVSLLDQRPTG